MSEMTVKEGTYTVRMKAAQVEDLFSNLEQIEVKDGVYGFTQDEVDEARKAVSMAFAEAAFASSSEKIVDRNLLSHFQVNPQSITAKSLVKLLPQLRAIVRKFQKKDSTIALSVEEGNGYINVRGASLMVGIEPPRQSKTPVKHGFILPGWPPIEIPAKSRFLPQDIWFMFPCLWDNNPSCQREDKAEKIEFFSF